MLCYKCGKASDVLGLVHDAEYFAANSREAVKTTVGVCPDCQSNIHWMVDEWVKFTDGESVKTERCNYCGSENTSGFERNGKKYCTNCATRFVTNCHECGDEIFKPEDEVHNYNGRTYCQECYEDNFSDCRNCGNTYPVDTLVDGECRRCRIGDIINDYSYKPTPKFHKVEGEETKAFFGIELEVDEGGESEDNAQELIELMGDEEKNDFYIKHDGSLNDGFEIVTHPMTLRYHKEVFGWKKAMRKLVNMGYTSHNSNTCGVHVHVSRNAFGNTEREQQNNIAKACYLMVKHWDKFVKFSRRTKMNYCNPLGDNWTSTQDADKYHDIPKDKYYCVNLGIRHTVEFRLWRGTLNYQSFIASLEMTDLLLQTSKELTWEEVKNLGFWGLIRRAEKYNYTELYGYVARIFKKTFNVEYSKDDTETPIDIKDFKAMMKQLAMAA